MSFAPNSLRLGNDKQVCRFSRLAEFIIFSKYREVAEKAIRDYLEYFATNKAISPETEDIDRLVKWYQTDSNTRIRYMTWVEELDEAVDRERERAEKAEVRANEAEKLAANEKTRADKYEKMLKEHGLL